MALPELAGAAFSTTQQRQQQQQQQQAGLEYRVLAAEAGPGVPPLQHLLPRGTEDGSLGAAGAAAALLGNLLEVGEGLLPQPPSTTAAAAAGVQSTGSQQQQQQQDAAVGQLLSVLLQLLLLVPLEWLGQGGGGGDASSSSSSGRRLVPDGGGGDDDDGAYQDQSSQQVVDVLGELYTGLSVTPAGGAAGFSSTSSGGAAAAAGAVNPRGRLKAPGNKEQLPLLVVKALGQLSGKKGLGLLRGLVSAILPANSSSSSSTSEQQQQQLQAVVASAGLVQQLCLLLWQLLLLKQHRQLLLLSLGVSTHFVQRLWFSFLRPINHAASWKTVTAAAAAAAASSATLAAAAAAAPLGVGSGPSPMDIDSAAPNTNNSSTSSSSSSFSLDARQLQDPGWMLPLLVFSQVFNVCLSTSDTEEFYAGEPLPLQELKGRQDNGSGGLVSFLRQSVWQVRLGKRWGGGEGGG